jgi:hypothetical protein
MSFCKQQGDEILISDNRVQGPGYLLRKANRADFTYPVDGWYWVEDDNIKQFFRARDANKVTLHLSQREAKKLRRELQRIIDNSGERFEQTADFLAELITQIGE